MVELNEHAYRNIVDGISRTADILLDTTMERNRYMEALMSITLLSDSEMGDGDGARRIARQALDSLNGTDPQ